MQKDSMKREEWREMPLGERASTKTLRKPYFSKQLPSNMQ
jgi:hypothetical protein